MELREIPGGRHGRVRQREDLRRSLLLVARELHTPASVPGRRRAQCQIPATVHEGTLETTTGEHREGLVDREPLRDSTQIETHVRRQQAHRARGLVELDEAKPDARASG